MSTLLDTRRYVETPEGVEVAIDVAGPVVRCWAWMLDLSIRWFCNLWIGFLCMFLGEFGTGVFLVWIFLLEWFYPVFFEATKGATPGKRALGLVVLHDDGTPVGWRAALIRSLLRFVDHLPAAPLFGLLCMGVSRDFKRLGDHAASTVVAYLHRPQRSATLPAVPAVPLPLPLAVQEQRAIVDFAQRSRGWTDERVSELAEILRPMVGGTGPDTAQRLQGMARWLRGGR